MSAVLPPRPSGYYLLDEDHDPGLLRYGPPLRLPSIPLCSACGRPLDPVSADIVARHPADFPHGALGACCHARKGAEDHGWGEAPEHGYDF